VPDANASITPSSCSSLPVPYSDINPGLLFVRKEDTSFIQSLFHHVRHSPFGPNVQAIRSWFPISGPTYESMVDLEQDHSNLMYGCVSSLLRTWGTMTQLELSVDTLYQARS
jgi:hypothetical protein